MHSFSRLKIKILKFNCFFIFFRPTFNNYMYEGPQFWTSHYIIFIIMLSTLVTAIVFGSDTEKFLCYRRGMFCILEHFIYSNRKIISTFLKFQELPMWIQTLRVKKLKTNWLIDIETLFLHLFLYFLRDPRWTLYYSSTRWDSD